MNLQLQELIEAINKFDDQAVKFVGEITNRIALMDEPLDPRNQFLITAALARLREARTLYFAAMGLPIATQGDLGVEQLQLAMQELHSVFEQKIADAIPLEGDDILDRMDERTITYNTLDHAEICCLSAITHFESLNEFLTTKQVKHEK